jgi:hypothetical protein
MIVFYHDSSNRIVADHNILWYRQTDFGAEYWQENFNSEDSKYINFHLRI